MKRQLVAIFSVLLLLSCGGNKAGNHEDEVPADSIVADADTTVVAQAEEDPLANLPMPKAADELFDDFIYNFSASKKLQMERIMFPLKKVNGNKVETIDKSQWKMERYFMRQQYYTLLFDSEKHMEVVKDTSLNHAVVEMIYFNTGAVIQHKFDRLRGVWMLTSVETIPITSSSNASFLEFYHRFSTDEAFQKESLNETIQFEGPDPDDDFARMEGEITADTWEAFAPELPKKMLYNIIYGQPHKEGNHKVFVLRGIANGMELEMTFQRKGGAWKLTKLTT
ncbi:MAG: DUF4348 domain-containing protein [Prevotella sp.]|nr:DUF4348 domain-containing protein [Prevotella sp.]